MSSWPLWKGSSPKGARVFSTTKWLMVHMGTLTWSLKRPCKRNIPEAKTNGGVSTQPHLPLVHPHHQQTLRVSIKTPLGKTNHLATMSDDSIKNLPNGPQSMNKGISPEYSLEGLMLKLQYFGHLIQRTDSLEKTLILGKTEGRRRWGWQRMSWLDGITDSMDKFEQILGAGDREESLACCSPWGHKELDTTEWFNWTDGPESYMIWKLISETSVKLEISLPSNHDYVYDGGEMETKNWEADPGHQQGLTNTNLALRQAQETSTARVTCIPRQHRPWQMIDHQSGLISSQMLYYSKFPTSWAAGHIQVTVLNATTPLTSTQ